MDYKTIQVSFRQKITVGRKELYDGLEVFVGGEVTPGPGESAEQALIELAVTLKNHMEKELQLAAAKPSVGVQSLVAAKETAMAPPQVAPVPQQFTQKAKPFTCIDGCGAAVQEQNRRCYPCYKKWNDAGRPQKRN